MEKWKGSWLAHGMKPRVRSRLFHQDDNVLTNMFLNLLTIVGFIFMVVILLHLFTGHSHSLTFRIYVAIFLILECTVICARLYICLSKKEPPGGDMEKIVIVTEKASAEPFHKNFLFKSYGSVSVNVLPERRNSL